MKRRKIIAKRRRAKARRRWNRDVANLLVRAAVRYQDMLHPGFEAFVNYPWTSYLTIDQTVTK